MSVEYMKERKKAQRKKNYWNMRVKEDFKPKKDERIELLQKIKMEEEKLKSLKINSFERVPLDALVKKSPKQRGGGSPSVSTAVTRSSKSGPTRSPQ